MREVSKGLSSHRLVIHYLIKGIPQGTVYFQSFAFGEAVGKSIFNYLTPDCTGFDISKVGR